MSEKKKVVRIKIDREKCIGAAPCVVLAPNTFELDDEHIAVLKEGEWDASEEIIAAAQGCPVEAIYIYDEDRNRIWPERDEE